MALWYVSVFCIKFCDSVQEFLNYWFLQSLKWKPLPRPCQSPKVELHNSINSSLQLPSHDEIITGKILACLHLHKNPSMLWQLHCINKAWQASVSQSLKWQAFEFVKKNLFYQKIVKWLCFKRRSLKEQLQFEMYASSIAYICKTWWNPKNKTTFDFCKCKFKGYV